MKRIVGFLLLAAAPAGATGLQAVGTDVGVLVEQVDFDLLVAGDYVLGTMEVRFAADEGETNAANLRFPLPPGAVLHGAEIYLPDEERWEVAETLGRRQGQTIYEDIVDPQPPDDPLLIQQIGRDFYRARVYPIDAAGSLRMRVHYAHLLEPNSAGRVLRVAFANPDASVATPANGVFVRVITEPGRWLAGDWVGLSTIPTSETADWSVGEATLEFPGFTMDHDILLHLLADDPALVATVLGYRPLDAQLPDHVHASWAPRFDDVPSVHAQPRNVVFVVDVSGSMSGQKLIEARRAVSDCVLALSADDWFGLVAFDSEVEVFRQEMTPGDDTDEALAWIDGLRAGSSTAIEAGLLAGAEIGATSPLESAAIDLLLITDGLPNVGATTAPAILGSLGSVADESGRDIRVFAVGIGFNLDQTLLNQLAQSSGGEATFALDDGEIHGQVVDLFGRIRGGGVTAVSVRVDDGPVFPWRRVFPGTTLYLGRAGVCGDTVSLSLAGETPERQAVDLTLELPVALGSDGIHLAAAPLFAKAEADRLERDIDENGESAEKVAAAVVWGMTYGIVTRYTSLLALDSPELYDEYGVDRVERDAAGIALVAVTPPSEDESRIGGQGTEDAAVTLGGSPPPGNPSTDAIAFAEEIGGCACGATRSRAGVVMMLLGLVWGVRRRRRTG